MLVRKRKNYWDSKKFSSYPELEERWKSEDRTFLGNWKGSLWYYNYECKSFIIHLSKSTICKTSRENPNVNCGFFQSWYIHVGSSHNKYKRLVRHVDGGCVYVGNHCTSLPPLLWTWNCSKTWSPLRKLNSHMWQKTAVWGNTCLAGTVRVTHSIFKGYMNKFWKFLLTSESFALTSF